MQRNSATNTVHCRGFFFVSIPKAHRKMRAVSGRLVGSGCRGLGGRLSSLIGHKDGPEESDQVAEQHAQLESQTENRLDNWVDFHL